MESSAEVVSNDMPQKVTRPWQGTVLIVLGIIGLVITALVILGLLFVILTGAGSSVGAGEAGGFLAMMAAFAAIVLGFLVVTSAINILFIVGLFKGWRWVVILGLVLNALAFLGTLIDFDIVSMVIVGIGIWLLYGCLQHPFYGGKPSVSTVPAGDTSSTDT